MSNPGFPPEHITGSDFVDPQLLSDLLMTPVDWGIAAESPGAPSAGLRILGHGPFISRAEERFGALNAIYDVAAQGEGPIPQANSHFERLSRVYLAASALTVLPVKNIADNPHTTPETPDDPETEGGLITHQVGIKFATLFNLRYEMLLTEIGHVARTRRSVVGSGDVVRRKVTEWAVSNEMYFIHQLSDQLNTQPLKASNTSGTDLRASAPFELPLKVPSSDHDCWQSYMDVFDRSRLVVNEIESGVAGLAAMIEADDARRPFVADRLRQP